MHNLAGCQKQQALMQYIFLTILDRAFILIKTC